MKKNFLLSALLFASACFVAQNPVPKASIYFETDQSELSEEARHTLDALAPTLLLAPDYQVNIEAFTDDRGTQEYNLRLAADRAASVQNYLGAKGLIADKTSVQNWGERKALGTSEENRQASRRVDVLVKAFFFNDFYALQQRLSANTAQTSTINPEHEQTISSAKGTLVIIPAKAFVFEDGTTPKGMVDIVLEEAFDPSDFVLHNLTTMSDGKILQTGGMVRITAQSGGRELQLADGASLTVSIPNGGNFDPSMELFYAQPTANGGVDWKPAGQKFRKTLRPNRAELSIDAELGKRIAAIKVPEYPQPALPIFKGQMPPEPQMPAAPYKPRAPKKPDWEATKRIFGGYGETSLNRKQMKKAQRHFNDLTQRYQRDSVKYVQLDERYQRNLEGYKKAKAHHIELHDDWENELRDRVRAILLYQREMKLHVYSKALAKTLQTKAKSIQQYDTYSNLYWKIDQSASEITQTMMLRAGYLGDKKRGDISYAEQSLFESIIGTKVIDKYKNYSNLCWQVRNALPSDTSSRVMSRMLQATGIKAISDSLQTEIKEKTLLTANSFTQFDAAVRGYVATVSQLGWINCDRFYDSPAQRMEVVVQEAEDAALYAVCKDINAMLPFYQNGNGSYSTPGLPKGQKITIIAIKIKDGMPQFAQRDLKVGDAVPTMAYRAMPLRDLKEELKKLNG